MVNDIRVVEDLLLERILFRYGAAPPGEVPRAWARSERDRSGRKVDLARLGIGGVEEEEEIEAARRVVEAAVFSEVRACVDRAFAEEKSDRDAQLVLAARAAASLTMEELNIPPGLRLDGDHDLRLSGDSAADAAVALSRTSNEGTALSSSSGEESPVAPLERAASYEMRAATIGYLPAIRMLRSIPGLRTPRSKIRAVVDACKAVTECVTKYYASRVVTSKDSSRLAIGADQLLPIMIFTVLRAMQPPSPPALFAQVCVCVCVCVLRERRERERRK